MARFATLADIEAFEAVPLAERELPSNTYEAIKRAAVQHPTKLALIFFLQGTAFQQAVNYTYRDLLGKLNQTANMLHDLGLAADEPVSYILPNLPQTYWTFYGGEAAGISNPINPLLEPVTIAELLNAANTKILVTLAPFPKVDIWEKVASIADQVPSLETILQVDLAQYLSGFKKLLVNLLRLRQKTGPVRARILDFDQTAASYPADRLLSGRTIASDDIASYIHTGGTTGVPKLAMQTHFNQVFDSWLCSQVANLQPGDRNYLGLPLFHNYGTIAIGLGSWISGAGIVMGTPQGFRGAGVIENLWQILAHYRCTGLGAVPTLFKALLNVPIGDSDLSALRATACGSAPLPVELARQFTEMTGLKVLEGYGLTEGTSVSAANPLFGTPRIGSIGYRFPYQEMRIAQLEGATFKRFCEPNEVGTVIIRGPNLFAGYRDSFHNQGVFIDSGDGRGAWLNTGDMGRQDEAGYFWLTGRQKELIIRGAHNIDPKQIEEPLHRHPAVALAAAVGRPDPRVGELPVVYIELKPGRAADEAELLAFARDHIGERAAIPKQVRILDSLPLTAVGKVLKLPLVYQQVVEVFQAELQQLDGLAEIKVTAQGDKRLGTMAQVHVVLAPGQDQARLRDQIQAVLGQYAIHYELHIA